MNRLHVAGKRQLYNNASYTALFSFLISGARSSHSSILVKLQELNEAQATLEEKSAELQSVIKELADCKKVAEKYVQSV